MAKANRSSNVPSEGAVAEAKIIFIQTGLKNGFGQATIGVQDERFGIADDGCAVKEISTNTIFPVGKERLLWST